MRLVLSATISTRESFHHAQAIRVLDREQIRELIRVLVAAGGERGMGTVGLGGLRWSPRWVAGVVVAMAAVAVVLWMVLDESDVRRTTRRPVVEVEDVAPKQREVVEEGGKRAEEPKPEVKVPVVQPDFVQIVKPREPDETLDMKDYTEVRIELPINLHIAGRNVVGAGGVDGKALELPEMLHEFVSRSGWDDPGIEITLPSGRLSFPANNRLTMLEVILRKDSTTADQWSWIKAWAHDLQAGKHQDVRRPLVKAEVSMVMIAPRLRSLSDRKELGERARERTQRPDVVGSNVDPDFAYPATPSSTGTKRFPVAVWESKVEHRRDWTKRNGNHDWTGGSLGSKRLVVKLASYDLDITTLEVPGMVVGYGMLSHAALDGALPMVRPQVVPLGEGIELGTSDAEKPQYRSQVIQHFDRFMWFVWADRPRDNPVLSKQLESQSDWRLWTLEEVLTNETEFLAIPLGRPILVNFGLDFGAIDATGCMLTVELQRGPAAMPFDMAVKPMGVKLDVLVVGPKRDKELPRPGPPAIIKGKPTPPPPAPPETPIDVLRRKHPLYAMPIMMQDWQHHVFIPGTHSAIYASAHAPEHPGFRWKQQQMPPHYSLPMLMSLPQDWAGNIQVTAYKGDQALADASYVVQEVHYGALPSGEFFPEKYGPGVRSPPTRHWWRMDSSLYHTRFRYPYAPTLSDWEFMYGRGRRWVGVHEAGVAEKLRSEFLVHARELHKVLEVPEAATTLMWREAGPRLEESEIPNVGKPIERQPNARPPEIPVAAVPEDAFQAAKELTKLPAHFELPQPIVEKPQGRFPEGTRRCLYSGTWVFAAHRDHGFGFVFIPVGWKEDVKIELEPWSTIGWDWKYIPRGHWPDGTPAKYGPKSVTGARD